MSWCLEELHEAIGYNVAGSRAPVFCLKLLITMTQSPNRTRFLRFLACAAGVLGGAGLGVILAFLATISAGAGHGTYTPAKLFFPYTMLLTLVDGRISNRLIALALIQFPVYGFLIGTAALNKYAVWIVIGSVAIGHAGAVAFCFSANLSGF